MSRNPGARAPASSFQDLEVWRKAHALVLEVYRMTKALPKEELYGLSSQLRRAAVSVPANIAEGFRRRTRADKAKFYNIAHASLDEARYYLILAHDLGFFDSRNLEKAAEEVSRMLKAYAEKVSASR